MYQARYSIAGPKLFLLLTMLALCWDCKLCVICLILVIALVSCGPTWWPPRSTGVLNNQGQTSCKHMLYTRGMQAEVLEAVCSMKGSGWLLLLLSDAVACRVKSVDLIAWHLPMYAGALQEMVLQH